MLVVARGYDYRDDLVSLRHYIREFRPVLVGVDGGAEALRRGRLPAPTSSSATCTRCPTRSLRGGAEVVVRADHGRPRRRRWSGCRTSGSTLIAFPTSGTSEDVALLLADAHGAELVVTVGTHATLLEFLDRGRAGTASTFLVRLKLGGTLVDAKAASRLLPQPHLGRRAAAAGVRRAGGGRP